MLKQSGGEEGPPVARAAHETFSVTPPRRTSPLILVFTVAGGCLVALLLLGGLAAAIMYPVFGSARLAAQSTACRSNLKQVAVGMMMYAQDYDEQLPPSGIWQDGVLPYIKNTQVFVCPSRRHLVAGYAYNALLDRRKMKEILAPAGTPMVFESFLGVPNGADRLESFVTTHSGRGNIAYADGHVTAVSAAPPASSGLALDKPKKAKKPAKRGR